MSIAEFIYLYVNASEEVRQLIAEILTSSPQQPESQE